MGEAVVLKMFVFLVLILCMGECVGYSHLHYKFSLPTATKVFGLILKMNVSIMLSCHNRGVHCHASIVRGKV